MSNALIVRPLPLTGLTAEGSAAGTLPTYVGNDYIGVVHRGTGTSTGSIVPAFDAASVDTVALLSTKFGAGARWALTVGGVAVQAASLCYPGGSQLPVNGRGHLLARFAAITASDAALAFDTLGGAPVEAGRLVIGKALPFARNFSFGGARGVTDTGKVSFSDSGAFLRRYGRRMRTVRISFEAAFKDEIEQAILPLLETVGSTDPVLIVLDPDADAQRMNRMYFGTLNPPTEAVQRSAAGWRWSCDMVSLI